MQFRILLLALALSACGGPDDPAPVPTASAGFDQRVRVGDTVTLDGSASVDPDARELRYAWTAIELPDGSSAALSDSDVAAPSFVTDRSGAYLFTLVVNNGDESSAPDPVVIEARNTPPSAAPACTAGSDCQVVHGRQATLDARGSFDEDGDALTFAWRHCQAGCSPCITPITPLVIANDTTSVATFTAPNSKFQSLSFQLMVSDAFGSSSACLTYTTKNTTPVAILAASLGSTNPAVVAEGATFTLAGTPSGDADGDVLTYAWTQAASSHPANIAQASSASTQVTAPVIPEAPASVPNVQLTFTLTVSDGLDVASVPITVQVNN